MRPSGLHGFVACLVGWSFDSRGGFRGQDGVAWDDQHDSDLSWRSLWAMSWIAFGRSPRERSRFAVLPRSRRTEPVQETGSGPMRCLGPDPRPWRVLHVLAVVCATLLGGLALSS
jgi:hypothetical protein